MFIFFFKNRKGIKQCKMLLQGIWISRIQLRTKLTKVQSQDTFCCVYNPDQFLAGKKIKILYRRAKAHLWVAELYANISFWNRNNIIFHINFTGFIIRGILPEGCSLYLAPCLELLVILDVQNQILTYSMRSRKKNANVALDSFKNYNNMLQTFF